VVRRQALLRDGGARRSGSLAAGDAIGSPDSPCSPSRRCRNVSWHSLNITHVKAIRLMRLNARRLFLEE
jgi:hypothetical protein